MDTMHTPLRMTPTPLPGGYAVTEALRSAVDAHRLGLILGSGARARPEASEEVREAAVTAITFRLLQSGRHELVHSAPPLEPELLTRIRQAVSLEGVRGALEAAGLVPLLHPYGVHAALTVELASIARQAMLRAASHRCQVCAECVGFAAQRTTEEAVLAAALVVDAA